MDVGGGIEERCFASSLMVRHLGLGVLKDRGYASRTVRAILRHKRIQIFPFSLYQLYFTTVSTFLRLYFLMQLTRSHLFWGSKVVLFSAFWALALTAWPSFWSVVKFMGS